MAALGAIGAVPGWPSPIVDYLTAPTFSGHPTLALTTVTYTTPATTGVRFHVKNTSAFNVVALAELSPALSNGRNFWKGPFLPATWISAQLTAGSTHDFDFAGLQADFRYFVRVRLMSYDTNPGTLGRAVGAPLITWAKAVTNP